MALIDGNYNYRPTYKPAAKPAIVKPSQQNKTQTIDTDWRRYQQQEAAAKAAAAQQAAQRQAAMEAAKQRQAAILQAQQQQQKAAAEKAAAERQAAIQTAQREQAARLRQEQIAAARLAQQQSKALRDASAKNIGQGYWAQNIAVPKKPAVEATAKKANYSLVPNANKGYWARYMGNPPDPQDIADKQKAALAWQAASVPEIPKPKPSLADNAANLLRNVGEGWDNIWGSVKTPEWISKPINEMKDAFQNPANPTKKYSLWDAYQNANTAEQQGKVNLANAAGAAIANAGQHLGNMWNEKMGLIPAAGPNKIDNSKLPYTEGNYNLRFLQDAMMARQPENYAAYLDSRYDKFKQEIDAANEKRVPWSQLAMAGSLSGMLTGAGSTPAWDKIIAEQAALPTAGEIKWKRPSNWKEFWGTTPREPMGPLDQRYIAEQLSGQSIPYKSMWQDYTMNGGVEPFNTYGPEYRAINTAAADLEAAAAAGPTGVGANWQDTNFFGEPVFYGPPDPVPGEAPYTEPGGGGGGGGGGGWEYGGGGGGGGSYMNYDTGYYSDRPSKRLGGYSRGYGGPSYAQGNAGGYGGVGYSQGGAYGGGGGGGYSDIYTGFGGGVAADSSGYSYNQYQQKPGDYWSQLARWVI